MPSRSVIIIAGAAIGLVALFAVITQGGYRLTPREVPAAVDTDADGSAYLREFLQEIGIETEISRTIPEAAKQSTLIVLEYEDSAAWAPSVLTFVSMGGRLLVTPAVDATSLPGQLEVVSIVPGVIKAAEGYGDESLGYTTGSGIASMDKEIIRTLAVVGDSPVMIGQRLGNGEIVAASDPVMLQNLVVSGDGAAILLGRLFLERPDDTVVFFHDATLVERDVNNPIGIFTTPRFLPFTLHALALLGLCAWMSAVRFGTPIEERTGKHRRIGVHVAQIAAFFRRHGHPSSIDLIHAEWATRELKARLRLPPHTKPQVVAEHAEPLAGASVSEIWELLEERPGVAEESIRERRIARERIVRNIAEEQDGAK
jgi:hypothetical protein